ncbi:MSMEG_1061 family FMN-dependent PPOX-type flavoprotein [Conexibacter stalactiti]|uniref:Pyridoxamine 5'-phosphate oxidase family protein n=1 Tax=Conexibacter stalactiti TaxID=1940611 RepID=A0ABU4HS81_9ACTN|nr:MSMEG_1061 family FMN-dependent PPOX-type flavoprotein [Conexibacter stalactiti]MDW5596128.1 pyridoxamine 5'-phosphate oxidase family protein [Conexibacter stalactiti]MEC5036770.1 MSMEG_1061 family FMN-dependent PPOX-type flavoprotein [Conexibacter stalactiti]
MSEPTVVHVAPAARPQRPARPSFRRLDLGGIRDVLGFPHESTEAKVVPTIGETARRFIAHAPFMTLATCDAHGRADCSPRGDGPGFVKVLDERTIALPDRTGNRLVQSFENLLENPAVGTLFFVPGLRETLRVNGTGYVTDDAQLLERFTADGRRAKLALVVDVTEVYLHCGKALIRSGLWDPRWQTLAHDMSRGISVFSLNEIEKGAPHGTSTEIEEWIEEAYVKEL